MKFFLLSTVLFLPFAHPSFASITPQQLQQFAASNIQCEQTNGDSNVTITFENCSNLGSNSGSCDVIASTDSDSRKLMEIYTTNSDAYIGDSKMTTLLDISDGNYSDNNIVMSSFVYNNDALLIDKDGSGFFFHHRSNDFFTFLFPENDQMNFNACNWSLNK